MKPGWQLAGEDYHPLATKDFSPYIQKIAASNAEMVLSGNWGSDLTIMHRQAADFGLKKPFGHIFLSDPVAMKEIGNAAIGSVTSEIYMVGVDNPANRAFIERWNKQFKSTENPWPEFAIGKGYNTMMFLAAALKKANSESLDTLIKAWEGMEFDGIMGKQVMRACDHQVQSAVAVSQIVAGPGKFYPFAYSGPVTLIPMDKVAVPPKETGNKRCE
jgi:branched-chain amino acid transport system substrate-binding protein